MKIIILTAISLIALAVSAMAGELEKKLIAACKAGDGVTVSALLKKKANPNAKTTDGFTALMYATEAGNVGAVKALLGAKAVVNAVSQDGYSALMIAADKGGSEIAQTLLQAGADVTLKNQDGQTAYEIAIEARLPGSELFKPAVVAKTAENPAPSGKKLETAADVEDFFGGRPAPRTVQPLTVEQKLQRAEQKYLAPVDGETLAERGARIDHYIKVESKKLADEMAEEFKKGRR